MKKTRPARQARQVSFRFSTDIREKLEEIKERDGLPLSEQLRRALVLWIEHRNQLAAHMRKAPKAVRP